MSVFTALVLLTVSLSLAVAGRIKSFRDPCLSYPCGYGTCLRSGSTDYFCTCYDGYMNSVINGVKTCVSILDYYSAYPAGLSPGSNSGPSSLNYYFRHLSVAYSAQPGDSPSWTLARQWNWNAIDQPVLSDVKDQGACRSCTAFSVAATMESAFKLISPNYYYYPPTISAQQFLDCGAVSCQGGWVGDVFDYASRMYLLDDYYSPYLAYENPYNCYASQLYNAYYGISMYEKVNFPGNFGLVLAVMQQPVVIAIEASSSAFLTYRGGIFEDTSCYANGVDHTMVVVGYDLDATPPYWVLRNSWGTGWGEGGYMRLAMAEGDGICGMNVLPGLYPIVKGGGLGGDPCNTQSYGSTSGQVQGSLNPCGGGTCQTTGWDTYECACNDPFTVAQNLDGTQTCVPSSPCSFSTHNPCRYGTCVDSTSSPGSYTCVCPLGYVQTVRAGDSTPSCDLAANAQGPITYTVPSDDFQLTCDVVYSSYGISRTRFFQLNPNADCSGNLAAGVVLNVTNDLGDCTVPYATGYGETCDSISSQFWSNVNGPIYGAGSPNPDLECETLSPGQLICLRRGSKISDKSVCTYPYTLGSSETCQDVINSQFGGNTFNFYAMNPGIYCHFIEPITQQTFPTQIQVCLRRDSTGSLMSGCSGRIYTVKSGDTCFRLISLIFGSYTTFKNLNGYWCRDSTLDVGDRLCTP